MKPTTIGIHGHEKYEGGAYNMLASFGIGLHDAFLEKNLDVKYTREWAKENVMPNFLIGFNTSEILLWDNILKNGMFNTIWTVDSVFYHNVDVINNYRSHPNFNCICLSDDDEEAINYFMPDLQRTTLPLAVDPKLWYSDNTERPKDIVFLASIKDPEEYIEEIKPFGSMYVFYMEMYKYALSHPDKNFWQIYNEFGLMNALDNSQYNHYSFFLKKLAYAVSYKKRIELVNSLSDYNIEIYGSGPWEKFLKGKAKYMGSVDLLDATEVLKHSKIAINLQPMQILNGIHDRIMNSSAAGCLVFTDKNKMIFDSYGDSLCYFNPKNFSGFSAQIKHYLKNDQKREIKAKAAQEITLRDHTWKNRADALIANSFQKPN